MKRIEADAEPGSVHGDTLTLPFELRQKSRLRARLESGEEVGLFLPRGRVLRGGDLLRADDGTVVRVVAAAEEVSTAAAGDAGLLARAAYHLGNRHVALQVGDGWVRYQHDHVLDEMVRGLGLRVVVGRESFEPEGGAYSHGGGGDHGHGYDHDHDGAHAHDRGKRRMILRRPR